MNKTPSLRTRDRPNMTRLTFDELRETMAMSHEGQVLDSFGEPVGLEAFF